MIKTHIRYRRTQRTLLDAILDATSNVTSEKVTSSFATYSIKKLSIQNFDFIHF